MFDHLDRRHNVSARIRQRDFAAIQIQLAKLGFCGKTFIEDRVNSNVAPELRIQVAIKVPRSTAYIHQQLANVIASAVLVPTFANANFGDGFEIRCRSDEIFISTAQVADIQIISSNTTSQLRIR